MNVRELEVLPESIRDLFIARKCAHCGAQYTAGMHIGNWACARHVGTRGEDKVWSCCGTSSLTERGQVRGCVRADHSSDLMPLSTTPASYGMALYPFIKPNLEAVQSRRRGPEENVLYVAQCDEEALLDAQWHARWRGCNAPE